MKLNIVNHRQINWIWRDIAFILYITPDQKISRIKENNCWYSEYAPTGKHPPMSEP